MQKMGMVFCVISDKLGGNGEQTGRGRIFTFRRTILRLSKSPPEVLEKAATRNMYPETTDYCHSNN